MLERTTEQEAGVREDAVPAAAAVTGFAAPVAGFSPVSAGALAALGPAQRAASVARLQASAGNAAVARVLGGESRTVAREPERCACGGVIGADGQCDRCRSEGKTGPAPASSPSEAMARMIAEDARQAAAQEEPERTPEPKGPPKQPPPARPPAHVFPLADAIPAPDGIQARAADAQALAAAPAPPPQAHGPPAGALAAPIDGVADLEGPTTTIRTAHTVARLTDPSAGAGAGPGVPDDKSKELERVKTMVAGTESSAIGAAESRVAAAEGTLGEAPHELEASLGAVEQSHATAATAQGEQAGAKTAQLEAGAKAVEQEGSQASGQVEALAPVASSLVSPARAIVEPAAVADAAGRIDAVGPGLDAGGKVQAALGAAAQPEWNVDLAEVVAAADGMRTPQVGQAVPMGERRSGDERIAQITAFTGQLGGRVNQLAGGLGSGIDGLSAQSTQALKQKADAQSAQADSASSALSAGFAAIKRGLTGDVDAAMNQRLAGVDQHAQQTRAGVGGIFDQARSTLNGAAQTASRLLGGLGSAVASLLPASLTGLTEGVGEARGRIDARQTGLIPQLGELARRAKDGIVSAAKAFADAKLRQWVAEERLLQQALDGARKLAKMAGDAIGEAIPKRWKEFAGKVVADAAAQLAKLQAAADAIVAKLRIPACIALEKAGSKYVNQYLPDLGGGINNAIKLTASTDAIVPLEEIGVPANLKVAAGASVEVSVLDGVYRVKVDGEAKLLLNESVGTGGHANVSSTGPVLNPGSGPTPTQKAFDKLGSGGAVAAKVGEAVADTATNAADTAAAGGPRGEVEGGLKGRVNAEWKFDANGAANTCDGIGGMLGLLAGLGASAALPKPFDQAFGAAVFKSYMPHLEHCRFSVGGTIGADADLKKGGLAEIKLHGSAEVMENFELKKDAHGNLVSERTRTLQAQLGAEAIAGLASGSFAKYRAFAGAEGIVRLTLSYDKATDEVLPSSAGGALALSFGAGNFTEDLIPEKLRTNPQIRRLLLGDFPGIDGPREVTVTLTIGRIYDKLEGLGRELKAYFAGPLESITVDGVLAIVGRHLATSDPQDYVKLTISQTQRKHFDIGEKIGLGVAAGADIDATAEHSASRTWLWPAADEIVELASNQAKPVTQVLEPEKKKDKKPKFGPPKETAWGPLRNDCGTWMLTYLDPKTDEKPGEGVKEWPGWWDAAAPDSGKTHWKQGHLLSQRFRGPGDLKNLTPITLTCNSNHYYQVEALFRRAAATRTMLCYFVEPIYTANGPKLKDDRHKNPDPSVWPNIALGLTCVWEFIDADGTVGDSGQMTILNQHSS